ncbi:hypothetical protein SAMN02745226_00204 [Fervidobacterium gondwanense DSM 13020]|uniref:Uncharacterized protein n=1 Tax=Fervidobacterium gondwanense DSM 13020 TaxID=1121883 RepID=A0A1M7RVA0_FERGO|nr:hypothetical protein SAMN02745226_00204 [Fervidobacterium gondwanense DSM 13020]
MRSKLKILRSFMKISKTYLNDDVTHISSIKKLRYKYVVEFLKMS